MADRSKRVHEVGILFIAAQHLHLAVARDQQDRCIRANIVVA